MKKLPIGAGSAELVLGTIFPSADKPRPADPAAAAHLDACRRAVLVAVPGPATPTHLPPAGFAVSLRNIKFSPDSVTVKVGSTVVWTNRDVWARIHERDLPYHPLHDHGYDSIGCAPCTQAGEGREGRWAGSQKTECGLHVA